MAAGRFDVANRYVHRSTKESYHYRNGYRDLDLCRGRDQSLRDRNGYGSYSGTIETGRGRDGGGQDRGIVRRNREWELVEFSARCRSGDAVVSESRAGDNEISKFKDRVSMPLEKKRKFSPIVWDRDDKEVKNSSKNRIVPSSDLLCSPPSLPESFGKSMDVTADVDVTMYAVPNTQLQGMQISTVKSHEAAGSPGNCQYEPLANSPTLLPPEMCRRNNEDLGQVEDNDYVEVQHISTSRWAYEEDSLGEICIDNAGDISTRRMFHHENLLDTSETGEFSAEDSEGSQGKLSTSDGQDTFVDPARSGDHLENAVVNDDFVEIDEIHDEVAGVSHLSSDLENDEDSSRFQEPATPKPRSMNMLLGCRSVFEYEKLGRINEGTYGVVYKARDKKTDEIMALKKVKMGIERDGFPLSALREMNILVSLHHPSIVDVKEVVVDNRDNVFMVMEYMEHDLKGLVEVMKQPFSEKEVKCLMLQLLEGVEHLHDNWVLHRDLKTSNLLLNNSGKLKICDFGLSRQYGSPLKPYTPLVVTLWYRAPEVLLGTEQYSTAIDMWSVGCIMAELLAKQPLFNGKTEFDQLDKIFKIVGTPNETVWPGFSKLPGAKVKFVKQLNSSLRQKFPAISFKGSPVLSDQGFDLLNQLLTYDPEKRITAEAALKHSWFNIESEQELLSIQESLARRLKSMTHS